MTQKERVLLHLKTQECVCVASLPMDLAYTARNRIGELRRDGIDIVGERCTRHSHKAPVYAYRLAQPVQQQMAL